MNIKKITIAIIVVSALIFFSNKFFFSYSASLFNHLYLKYKTGDDIFLLISFEEIGDDQFKVITKVEDSSDEYLAEIKGDEEIIVNRKLKNKNGSIFQNDSLGPIWIPPKSIKAGGRVRGGDSIDEIKKWNKWEVGVVSANVAGALKGTWYYDKKTGFLVGMKRDTAIFSSEEIILEDTNLKELQDGA